MGWRGLGGLRAGQREEEHHREIILPGRRYRLRGLSVILWAGLGMAWGVDPLDVPPGSFTQGDDTQPDAAPRSVYLSGFRLDADEVTVRDFEVFVASSGYQDPAVWGSSWSWHQVNPDGAGPAARAAGRGGSHPVVAVTWHEADAYCRWRGGRLPTEAEWERVACDGVGPYPWGASEDVAAAWYAGSKYGVVETVATQPAGQADPAMVSTLGGAPHGRQRLGVDRRLVWPGQLRCRGHHRPDRTGIWDLACSPRRLLHEPPQLLSLHSP